MTIPCSNLVGVPNDVCLFVAMSVGKIIANTEEGENRKKQTKEREGNPWNSHIVFCAEGEAEIGELATQQKMTMMTATVNASISCVGGVKKVA